MWKSKTQIKTVLGLERERWWVLFDLEIREEHEHELNLDLNVSYVYGLGLKNYVDSIMRKVMGNFS